jgi:hypothetical protein
MGAAAVAVDGDERDAPAGGRGAIGSAHTPGDLVWCHLDLLGVTERKVPILEVSRKREEPAAPL